VIESEESDRTEAERKLVEVLAQVPELLVISEKSQRKR
jgi:hypothetical protein